MNICGLSIDSNKLNIVILHHEIENNEYTFFEIQTKKIQLVDETNQESIRAFYDEFRKIMIENSVSLIGIKKRLHKGKFSGGAISFKIEAIIQMIDNVNVVLLPAKTIAKNTKELIIDTRVLKYQYEAYKTAYTLSFK